jgi:hypothetical protein
LLSSDISTVEAEKKRSFAAEISAERYPVVLKMQQKTNCPPGKTKH